MRPHVAPFRGGQQGAAHRTGAAVPARGHPDAAVRESRPLDVRSGRPDRPGRHVAEVHVQRVTARHAGGRPAAQDRRQGAGRHREQPPAVPCVRRDQGMSTSAGSGAVSLRAAQVPPAPVMVSFQLRAGRMGGPHAPPAARRRRRAVQFGQDRHRVRVTLTQSCHGQVFFRQFCEPGPAFPGPARPGQRQVQPPRLHRRAERRGDGLPCGRRSLAGGRVRNCPHRCREGRGCRRRAPPPRRGCPRSSAGWSRLRRRATGSSPGTWRSRCARRRGSP